VQAKPAPEHQPGKTKLVPIGKHIGRNDEMKTNRGWTFDIVSVVVATLAVAMPIGLAAQQTTAQVVQIGDSDLGGVVTSANGLEAGVWVIAETADLPTKFARIVVTDDYGRYLMPNLPKAKYTVWVRGYALVDSEKVEARPGETVDLRAMPAPSPAAAAQYYPAVWTDWRPHVPTPEAVIRAMLEAAMKVLEPPAEPAPEPGPTNAKPTKPRPARLIVTASKPRPWDGSTGLRRVLEPIGNFSPAEAEQRYFAMLAQSKIAA
jgi:hypothetical protein